MLHPLLLKHPRLGRRTALLFSGPHGLGDLWQTVPPTARQAVAGGWVVSDAWAPSLVVAAAVPVCKRCALSDPCGFGRDHGAKLAREGYMGPWGDDAARAARRLGQIVGAPWYGEAAATGLRAFSRLSRAVDVVASTAARMFPAPKGRPASPPVLEPSLMEHALTLGLMWPCTLEEVHRAFLPRAFRAHPDQGGDPEQFRRIVQARDALAAAWRRP